MKGEIVPLRLPRRVVAEDLRSCPQCGQCDGIAHIVSQSFGLCRTHGVFWHLGQNLSDKWRRQTPREWAVTSHVLSKMRRVHTEPQGQAEEAEDGAA